MNVGKVVWYKGGYGLRRTGLPAHRMEGRGHSPLACSTWQVWVQAPGGARCVDRALTRKRAVAMARAYVVANPVALLRGDA